MRARIAAFFRSLLVAHASPGSLAGAVFVGAVLGCTPFFGFHLFMCIAVAWAFRLNQPAVYAAANISIPPLVPFLGFASVEIGERLVRGRFLPLAVADFRNPAGGPRALAERFFVDWLVGGLVVGAGIGAVMALFVYAATRGRAARVEEAPAANPTGATTGASPSEIDTALVAAARRYHTAPRGLRYYAWFKYRLDPCYRRLAELIPPRGLTVDLGTGLGMLPLLLGLLPGEREAVGVELDTKKIRAGLVANAGLARVRLVEGDALAWALPPCDTVTIIDMLHYFDPAVQRMLLARAAAALRAGGQLLIREGDAEKKGGARYTRMLEALAVRLGWNLGDGPTRFRGAGELEAELSALGLIVTVETLAGRLHPGNVLLCGRCPDAVPDSGYSPNSPSSPG